MESKASERQRAEPADLMTTKSETCWTCMSLIFIGWITRWPTT